MVAPNKSVQFLTQPKDGMVSLSKLVGDIAPDASLASEDTRIADTIIKGLRETGTLPFDWTPQEDNFIRLQPQERWLKYLIYRYKFKVYPREHIVAEFPVYILLEPVSTCNLRCTMCFQIDKSFTRKPYMGIMPLDFFKRMIDEAVEGGTCALTLASRGEPTMHPELAEMLGYASGKFFDLKLNTNATRLDEDLCHAILSSSVNEIVFSIDSHEKEIYENIRVRGVFEEVLENIVRFHKIRERDYPDSKLSTRVSGVKFRQDQDAEGFRKFWSDIVDHVVCVNIQNRWDTYNSPVNTESEHPCKYLWERFYVWFDGTCNPCDVDYKSKLSPGSVCERSIRSVWHSDEFKKLREDHISGNRAKHIPCDRCGV